MAHESTSEENSRKLDRILNWIEGDANTPGFNQRIRLLETILFGKEGQRGMVQEHLIMWRIHVWILCTLSGLLGMIMTLLVQKLTKVL
jgi:hypothetical protein